MNLEGTNRSRTGTAPKPTHREEESKKRPLNLISNLAERLKHQKNQVTAHSPYKKEGR